jgi:uncharacterized protein YegJ (DUF2314 family)
MVQVRCPECGYLQALSEERAVASPGDALTCPHCNARIPLDRPADHAEEPPEDAVRKILAFSQRLIAGSEVTTEMACALENLVRHYGHAGESAKALGIGFGRLGDLEKAETYLTAARARTPDDPETTRAFFLLRLSQDDMERAAAEGLNLIGIPGRVPFDQEVADTAAALSKIGRTEEARRLLETHGGSAALETPSSEGRARSLRAIRKTLSDLVRDLGPLGRLLSFPKKPSESCAVPQTARNAKVKAETRRPPAPPRANERSPKAPTSSRKPDVSSPLVEYWIYSRGTQVPPEDQIRERLVALFENPEDQRNIAELFDAWIRDGRLTIVSYSKADAPALFEYPEDMLPKNPRLFGEADREILRTADIIVAARCAPRSVKGLDYLSLTVCVVEALRGLIGGVIQDAVSHILLNGKEWRTKVIEAASDSPVEPHVRFEVLDEGKSLWVHSHGMQKFGLPELEMEGVPTDSAPSCVTFMLMAAETLLKLRLRGRSDFRGQTVIEHTPFLFRTEVGQPDEERHFPLGSLRIIPYLVDYDPQSADTLRHVLRICSTKFLRQSRGGRAHDSRAAGPVGSGTAETSPRELLLEANKRARTDLHEFKKSFQNRTTDSANQIHAVKVGFPVRGGPYEWMWVSVDVWRGDSLVGRIENDPVLRKDLAKGARVQINETEIFDWAILANGDCIQGAYTEDILKDCPAARPDPSGEHRSAAPA